MLIKRPTLKKWLLFDIISYLEEFFNLKWKQLIPQSSASLPPKRDTVYVKWQSGTSNDEKHLKILNVLINRAHLQFKTVNLRNWLKLPPFELYK